MRKGRVLIGLICILVCVAMLSVVAWSDPSLPPPFGRIKAIAMTVAPDKDGDYIWEKEITIKGKKCYFKLVYFPAGDTTAIAVESGPQLIAVCWWGIKNQYVIEQYMYGQIVGQEFISEEKAIEAAYGFFRKMVEEKIV